MECLNHIENIPLSKIQVPEINLVVPITNVAQQLTVIVTILIIIRDLSWQPCYLQKQMFKLKPVLLSDNTEVKVPVMWSGSTYTWTGYMYSGSH